MSAIDLQMSSSGDEVERDLAAADVAWAIDGLLPAGKSVDDLLDEADVLADGVGSYRGRVATLDSSELVELMTTLATIGEFGSLAGHYAMLRFSEDTSDPERGAAMQSMQERSTAISTKLIFVDLEFAAADDEHVALVLADQRLEFCRHHLENLRRNRPHLLSEPEEMVLT
ncbi:MAG: oligoendopeptidase F, partial [Acidimicrobiales bacterium]